MENGLEEFDRRPIERTEGQLVLAGRYRVVRQLTRGALVSAYIAEDTSLDDRKVVIRIPSATIANDQQMLASIKEVALASMGLVHPNIVALRAHRQTNGGMFMVMDYVEADRLEDVLVQRGRLSPEQVAAVFKPIAEALDYAHPRGVFHRDVGLKNIAITNDDRALIMDFGIARLMKDSYARLTGKDTTDSLPYMSPEQLTGAPPTAAQDIYSLAATIYACLASRLPFRDGDVRQQIMRDTPAPPTKQKTAMVAAVMAGLSKNAADRPQTCMALLGTAATKREPAAMTPAVAPAAPTPPQEEQDMLPDTGPTPKESCRTGHVVTNSIGMKLAYCPAGKFTMGSPEREEGRTNDEKRHTVTLTKGFFMGVVPVTRAQFQSFVTATNYKPHGLTGRILRRNTWERPGFEQGDDHPAIWINWHAAKKFCDWLSEKEGREYRLPTEAQWEYACRSRTKSAFSGTRKLKQMGWYSENSHGRTHGVGQKNPNAWGLYDMHGNVWEWCHDWYMTNIGDGAVSDPKGGVKGTFRVLRGGAWYLIARFCRSACRPRFKPEFSSALTGMRVVLRVD